MPIRSLTLLSIATLATLCANAFAAAPVATMEPGTAEGSVGIAPGQGVSGEYGTWTVTLTVGEGGIASGGGIRVQLPDAFHSGIRNSANRLQAMEPKSPHYISANCSRVGVKVKAIVESESKKELIKHAKVSLDGRYERYVFVTRAVVEQGALKAGDRISIVYGDRTGGSPGMLAGAIATEPRAVLAAVDANGDGGFKLTESRTTIRTIPGVPVEALCHAPSNATAGNDIEALVVLLDKQFNAALVGETFDISVLTGKANHPKSVAVADKGFARFTITPFAEGPLRIKLVGRRTGLTAVSNPIDVTGKPLIRSLFWGDLHSHTDYSWDGVGNDSFNYARNVTGLDFYAMSDHSLARQKQGTRGLGDHNFKEYIARTESENQPGNFATLHAYECSFGRPYGHHIVYFRDQPTVLMYPSKNTLEEMWQALEAGKAITIPHHTGKFPGGVDFGHHDERFRRAFEIYSGHGLSEVYNPGHPLSFEHSKFTSNARSLPAPTFAQDAWIRGLRLGTIASSDDHRAQPGQPHYGLVAVSASSLTRHGVFDALHARRSYGTSGSKIILDFRMNGAEMGSLVETKSPPNLSIRALGTDKIKSVELLRWQKPDKKFQTIKEWKPGAFNFKTEFKDETFQPGAIYYTRVTQEKPVRGLTAMAWSSPIWTQR
jgi:hypothetical protein